MSFTALSFDGQRLNFTQDCNASARFIATYSWGTGDAFFATYRAVYGDVLAALPAGAARPSECEVLSWFKRNYESPNSTLITSLMYRTAFDHCAPETCPMLSLAGNADIAGIGMLAAYLMEAVMATAYAALLLVGKWRKRKGKKEARGRLTSAVAGTVDDFLDTALFFSGAIIIAGIVMTPRSRRPYELLQATLASALTLSAAVAIWVLREHRMSRRKRRDGCLAALIALALAQTGAVVGTGKASEDVTRREFNCLRSVFASMRVPSAFYVFVQALTALAAALVLAFLATAYLPIRNRGRGRGRNRNHDRHRDIDSDGDRGSDHNVGSSRRPRSTINRHASVVVCVYALAAVWITFATLWWMRRLVRANMILSSDERTWGFGQVVALSSWLPTQLSFIEILLFGEKSDVQGRVPHGWTVERQAEEKETPAKVESTAA